MKKDYKKFVVLTFLLAFTFSVAGQSALSKSKYGAIISSYLQDSNKTSKLSSTDLEDIYVTKEMLSKKTGIANVYLNQRYQGIKIFNAVSSVGIKNDKVFHFTDKFKSDIKNKINATTPALNEEQAIQKAASHFKLGSIGSIQAIEQQEEKLVFSKGSVSQESIPVELVYFQLKDGSLRLSWDLSIYTLDSKHWWSIRVDAVTGEVLNANDWVVSCNFGGDHTEHGVHHTKKSKGVSFDLFKANNFSVSDGSEYTVFPIPVESPNHGSRQVVSEPADDIASPFGWHDDDGVDGPEYTTTQGNNVIAQLDDDGNNGDGLLAEGTASLDFNFALDLNEDAAASPEAAITNLFYMSNIMHDIWYQYGFDVESGAFQTKHYQRVNSAGAGDPVNADAQDGSGVNNANFGTGPDGNSPRMQMFLWSKPDGLPLTINTSSVAGIYGGVPAAFGNPLPDKNTPLTGDLVLIVDDNSGSSTDANDACDPLLGAGALSGKIVVIRRGECEFGVKVLAAENAGAVAVIMVNNVATDPIAMGAGAEGDNVTIPSLMVSQSDGEAIIAALSSESINASLVLPDRLDGDFDNLVIGHEYGHGISNRLTGGGFNTDCLPVCTERDADGFCVPATNTEQMGEGWSDFFGLMITMKSSDLPSDARGIGTFVSSEPTDGPGIRPFRYSPDTSVNPLTYDDTNNTASISAPHGVGSVWCTMLWDLTWKYIEKYGFDSDFYYGTGGNNKIMQIVMDGLKLQPCNPGFVDGRDAILAADMALTGGEDQCMIWEVFAARGLGLNADQGDSLLRTDQVEDFTMPDPADASLANCTTLSTAALNSKVYRIYPNPAINRLTVRVSQSLGDVTITLVDINGRKVLSKEASLIDEVELNTSTLQSGLYILNIESDFINVNEKIIIN
ncbi:T9SS-dependent M36 family metallopeptidase [Flaviramulus aquimarinus]|uniref:T9SS-dependent M36 family metallopeptidase n=1 Tax=Flaviramulus aquimarinus TaxID=1170456 RepID=A0ABP9F6M4_9FLAO